MRYEEKWWIEKDEDEKDEDGLVFFVIDCEEREFDKKKRNQIISLSLHKCSILPIRGWSLWLLWWFWEWRGWGRRQWGR